MRLSWIHWHICNLAFGLFRTPVAAACLDDGPEPEFCQDVHLGAELPSAAQGDMLLQARASGFKGPSPPADELEKERSLPDVEKVGDGEEHIEQAVADMMNGVTGRGETTQQPPPQLQNTSATDRDVDGNLRRRRSTFQVSPPLKESAVRADENYKHDEQFGKNRLDNNRLEQAQESGPISVQDAMEIALSISLLGSVALVMTSFYLVNWPNQDIQQASWRLFSTTASVFLAVLLFSATQELMGLYEEARGFPHDHGEPGLETSDHGPVSTQVLILSFVRFLGLLLLLQIALWFVDKKDVMLHGLARLGSHIVAFAGIDVFAALQASEVYPDWMKPDCIRGWFMSASLVWGIFDVAEYARWRLIHSNMHGVSKLDKARQEWFAECREGEHEAAGLILGLLLSQHVRYALTGVHAPLHGGEPQNKSFRQVWELFVFGLLLGVMVVPIEMSVAFLSRGLSEFTGRINWKHWSARLIRICRETLAMTMAWCFLYWGQWEFWYLTDNQGLGWGSQIAATLCIAIILSALCFSGIFVIEFVLDFLARIERTQAHQAGFIALGKSLGLVMGLGWETCFREAIKGASKSEFERHHTFSYLTSNMVLIAILCLVVLPAWILFIHPKSLVNRRDDILLNSVNRSNPSLEYTEAIGY